MFSHDLNECGVVVVAGFNKWSKLTVPDKIVTVNLLTIAMSQSDDSVGIIESEDTSFWFSGLPFHGVLWCDGAKVKSVVNECSLG